MDGSNLPLPLKRQSLMDALNNTRGRTSIQLKHPLRDPGGKLGPSSRRVDRPQVAGDHLKRRTGHGSKKSNLPFSLNGSKVSDLCTADTCVPVTAESVVPGKVRAGSTTLMKSKLLQLQERNRLIEARRRLDADVTGMTSPTELKIDANDVNGNGPLPGCSAISPAYHELGPILEGASVADGHTYQSIGELLRDEVSKPEVHQTGSPLPAKLAPDPGAKQVRSKSRSIFSKLWNLRRTQQALQKDTVSSKLLTASTTSTTTPPVENKQPSQNSTEAVQKSISLGSRDSLALDSKNNFRSTMTSSRNDDVTRDDRGISPDSIDDARKSNTVEKDRIRSDFADKSSVSHRQNNSVEHSGILTLESNREPNAHDDCLSSLWNYQISNKTRACHRGGNASENLCQIGSTIGQLDVVGESLSSKSHNVQFDRIKPFSTTLYGIWPIAESSSHNACFPTGSPMGLVIGKVAHRLRFSSPCCGVRMAELRAVWRKCEVVALISDAVYSRYSLATRQNKEDFAWKLLREDASRLLSKEPNYFSAQSVQGVAQDHEFHSSGRLLPKRTTKDNEYVERFSNQCQAVDSKENYSKRERNWTIDDFKLSEYYAGPNKTDDSFATAGNLQDYNHEMKSPCKETKANESKLKQPKRPTKYNTSVVQVAKAGLNNSARTNNSVATKPSLLQTKQQLKEQNIYKNTGSDRVTSAISAESSDEQHQSQVKQALVRYIETAVTPAAAASAVLQPERSSSSQPDDPEMPALKPGSYIPRIRIKPKVQTTETDNEQSTAVETSHSQLHHENGFRSVENPQDDRNSYPGAELVPYDNALASDLRDSGSLLLSRLLEACMPSSAIKDRTAKEDYDEEEDDEELEFRELEAACASLSHTSDLSTSEPRSMSNNTRYLEISINEITADSCAVLTPPPDVGPCTHSGNKDVDLVENKRWRGKSQIVAPRTDATRCRQQIERFRSEASNHAKHEIHQNL